MAVEAVKDGSTIRRAAIEYGVKKSTLHDYYSGKVRFGAHQGPERYLSDEEEHELYTFLVKCAKIGFAKSQKEVLALVCAIVADKKKVDVEEVTITSGWWSSFKKRYPQLTVHSGTKLAYVRAIAQDPEVFDNYFDILEANMKKNNFIDNPHCIFNCDESGFPLDHKPGKLIALKGMKQVNSTTSGDKSQITILACVSAAGQILPPMIIFDRKRLRTEFTHNEINGTLYGLSDKGWIDAELFELWFEKLFLKHAPLQRPLLLLLDGHSAHYHPSLIRKALLNKVVLFCLPPHTTHLAQPLDKTCFSPLKSAWHQECFNFMAANPGKTVNRYNFNEIFSKAWAKGMTPANAISGF